jgi:hypothetical protein
VLVESQPFENKSDTHSTTLLNATSAEEIVPGGPKFVPTIVKVSPPVVLSLVAEEDTEIIVGSS